MDFKFLYLYFFCKLTRDRCKNYSSLGIEHTYLIKKAYMSVSSYLHFIDRHVFILHTLTPTASLKVGSNTL